MTVLVAFDSFKGSLPAREACEAFAEGVSSVSTENVICMPIADGGEGLIDCLSDTLTGRGWSFRRTYAQGPYGNRINPRYLLKNSDALIEMAEVCGLNLVESDKRHVIEASSFGLGEVIADAVRQGARHIRVGLGGSATNDLGLGCLQALGVKFFDDEDKPLPRPLRASDLCRLTKISVDSFKKDYGFLKVTAVCDVDNPLLGARGATNVFAPQKGASSQELAQMENAMSNAAAVLSSYFGVDVTHRKGAGAAGGMGAALMWFFNATLLPGIEAVLEAVDINHALDKARYVITGEGSFDVQSLSGKAPVGVLRSARAKNKPVALVAGRICSTEKELRRLGFASSYELRSFVDSDEQSMARCEELLYRIGQRWAREAKLSLF